MVHFFQTDWIYDEVSFKEGTEHFSTRWRGWNTGAKPRNTVTLLPSCNLLELTGHPKMSGKVARIGVGSGRGWPRSVTSCLTALGGEGALWFIQKLSTLGEKKRIAKFAFNDMSLKTKTIAAALIFLPFLLLGEQSALACCFGFPLKDFLTPNRVPPAAPPFTSLHNQQRRWCFISAETGRSGPSSPARQSVLS